MIRTVLTAESLQINNSVKMKNKWGISALADNNKDVHAVTIYLQIHSSRYPLQLQVKVFCASALLSKKCQQPKGTTQSVLHLLPACIVGRHFWSLFKIGLLSKLLRTSILTSCKSLSRATVVTAIPLATDKYE